MLRKVWQCLVVGLLLVLAMIPFGYGVSRIQLEDQSQALYQVPSTAPMDQIALLPIGETPEQEINTRYTIANMVGEPLYTPVMDLRPVAHPLLA